MQSSRSLVRRRTACVVALVLALAFLLPSAALAAPASNPNRVYFPQTGHYLAYGFLDYWRANGGLMMFGYPITEEIAQNGQTVQYFERAVFEYHAEAPVGWTVQLRRLGAIESAGLQGQAPFQPVSATSDLNCTYFAPTGHRLCFGFRDYWQDKGGLRIFGYPISEEFTDPSTGLTVQYFERARFEYHPDNPPGYQVLLGLLSDAAAKRDQVGTAPLQASSDVPAYAPDLWEPSRCYTWQLEASFSGGTAATGHVQEIYALRNASLSTCTLYGYPGLLMLDAQGNPMPTTVVRGSAFTFPDVVPDTVLLAPGDAASFAVDFEQVPIGNQTTCPVSARLEITPPNAYEQLIVPATIHACDGTLHVSPVILGIPGVVMGGAY